MIAQDLEMNSVIFNKSNFIKHNYHDRIFHDFLIHEHFGYALERSVFRYFDPLNDFLIEHPSLSIYLTNNTNTPRFKYFQNDILVNIDSLISFCDNIGASKKDKQRIKAFFGQHLSIQNIRMTDDEKDQFIKANLSEHQLIEAIKNISGEAKDKLVDVLLSISDDNKPTSNLSEEKALRLLTKFLKDRQIQESILNSIPQLQINALRELKSFVESNLDKNESFFQKWLDEDKGKHRKKRCLIFGIEYVDPKREGEIMGRKRFDILATQDRESHILIELKSPNADVFTVSKNNTLNGGVLTEYKLSDDLSRAIPQILGYKKWYSGLPKEKIQELGICSLKEISDCIIVIGTRVDDPVWLQNFNDLRRHMSVKILTYTDLIEKMNNTIHNLEEHL